MPGIEVEQAIYASSCRPGIRGYQLVAKSAGIDPRVATELCRWAPTRLPGSAANRDSINYFPIDRQRVAISRTMCGGPEYSSRGGEDIVTRFLVLRTPQFRAYGAMATAVARTALALGGLTLRPVRSDGRLSRFSLPGSPLRWRGDCPPMSAPLVERLTGLLHRGHRVALIGLDDPLAGLDKLLARFSPAQRQSLAFSTGLQPTYSRPFAIHCLQDANARTIQVAEAEGLTCIDVSRSQLSSEGQTV
ncbi:GAP1-N2 domain-containing protein [Roseimaritima sediminicola]|uniref:GAP1-N2 domain-containing protein n=1 Tax=Roseimaritima sediminicola TaxID=2662066 RepID=UPI0012985137|nr:hypothetical protein [Roseimaritima sediminicola]